MRREIIRQLVHLSGVGFVYLSQFFEQSFSALMFLLISISFLLYSLYIRRMASGKDRLLDRMEAAIRKATTSIDRDLPKPFVGPFWFFFGFFAAYAIFPLRIAMISCAILSVSDSLSTLAGRALGKKQYLPGKTPEGTVTFMISSFAVSLAFVPLPSALLLSALSSVAETLPAVGPLRGLAEKGYVNDNILIPMVCGIVLLLLGM